jgi:16S rRNA (adenine1518-N6/adenine1519-N6)-dimethyltransferase
MSAPRSRPTSLHRYGQNHLVDANTLNAIVRLADVRTDDVVLEVGAATGVLSERLLARADVVHLYEIDRRFAPALDRLASTHANLRVHWGDALRADLRTLDPPPTALVANLAYNIAIPLVMRTLVALPSVRRWAVMVQKELGERLFALPTTKAYSAVSVIVQLACRREQVRAVPPSAFRPQPRVDSSFITFVRAPGVTREEHAALDQLARLAFGQRRKVLTNTLAGAARGGVTLSRDDVHRALEELGLGPAARPEELSPQRWLAFAHALGWLADEVTG